MHEMSLVSGMLQQLKELAAANNASKILKITLDIGPLSGVVIDSFQFGYDILSKEDELTKDAELIIHTSPVIYRCSQCAHPTESQDKAPEGCPECGELFLIPEGGDDLILQQVEME